MRDYWQFRTVEGLWELQWTLNPPGQWVAVFKDEFLGFRRTPEAVLRLRGALD